MSGIKIEYVTVPNTWGGRDAGKVFCIREADAADAEKWALRVVLLLKGTTAQIPESLAPLGMIAVAIRGINSLLGADVDSERLIVLLDELLDCVTFVRDPSVRDGSGGLIASPLVAKSGDIMEVRTRLWLRSEVLRIHTNFSLLDAAMAWLATAGSKTSPEDSSTT